MEIMGGGGDRSDPFADPRLTILTVGCANPVPGPRNPATGAVEGLGGPNSIHPPLIDNNDDNDDSRMFSFSILGDEN